MSLAGRNRTRGKRYEVWRATEADVAGGLKARTWAVVTHDGRGMVDTINEELVQRIFGREVVCDFRLFASPNADIRHRDGVVMRSPDLDGRRFLVSGIARQSGSMRSDHLEIALEETTEAIP